MKRISDVLGELMFPMADRCPVCSRECTAGLCDECISELDSLRIHDEEAVFSYDGLIKEMIHRYKFFGEKYLCDTICELMRSAVKEADVITNVPVHAKRRRARGYDQSLLMAKKLSELCGIPYAVLLRKDVHTKPQSTLSGDERKKNAEGAYSVIAEDIKGKHILLIDDVITTGATMSECRRLLLEAGAGKISLLAFAKTQ